MSDRQQLQVMLERPIESSAYGDDVNDAKNDDDLRGSR